MKNLITSIGHSLINGLFDDNDVMVDATAGNGLDTIFLASKAKHVYAFDILENALTKTKTSTKQYTNITYVLDSHENIFLHLDVAKGYIFNLGYLPGGDKTICTNTTSTIKALSNILPNLRSKDFIMVVCYPGHSEGKKESEAIALLLDSLDHSKYNIMKTELLFKKSMPPHLLLLIKE